MALVEAESESIDALRGIDQSSARRESEGGERRRRRAENQSSEINQGLILHNDPTMSYLPTLTECLTWKIYKDIDLFVMLALLIHSDGPVFGFENKL